MLDMPLAALSSSDPSPSWVREQRVCSTPATSTLNSFAPSLVPPNFRHGACVPSATLDASTWAQAPGANALPLDSTSPTSDTFSSLLTSDLGPAFDFGMGHDPSTSTSASTSQAGVQNLPPQPLPSAIEPSWPFFPSFSGTADKPEVPPVLATGPSLIFSSPLSSPAASNASGPLLSPPQHPGAWDPARLSELDSRPFAMDQSTWCPPSSVWSTTQAHAGPPAKAPSSPLQHQHPDWGLFAPLPSETAYPQLHAAVGLQEPTPESTASEPKSEDRSPPKPSKTSTLTGKARNKTALPKNYTCNLCGVAFARNHDLRRHARIHMANKPYSCPTCQKQFSRKDAMSRHFSVKSGCLRAWRDHPVKAPATATTTAATTTVPMQATQPAQNPPPAQPTSGLGEFSPHNLNSSRRPSMTPGSSALPPWPQQAGEDLPSHSSNVPPTGAGTGTCTGTSFPFRTESLLSQVSPYALFGNPATLTRSATVGSGPQAPASLWTAYAAAPAPRSAPLEDPPFVFAEPSSWM